MIKNIWNWIKNLFTPKREVVVLQEEVIVKSDHCSTHSRFKKSCPACKELAYG